MVKEECCEGMCGRVLAVAGKHDDDDNDNDDDDDDDASPAVPASRLPARQRKVSTYTLTTSSTSGEWPI